MPADWQYGDLSSVRLFPVCVPLPIVRCEACGKYFRVEPEFMIKGTILTFPALVFVAFSYETSGLTWRQIADIFCKDGDKISHSTLYTAVHKLGKLVEETDLMQNMRARIPSDASVCDIKNHWPPLKCQYPHTKMREEAVRSMLCLLTVLLSQAQSFLPAFLKYIDIAQSLLKPTTKSLPKLYAREKRTNTS